MNSDYNGYSNRSTWLAVLHLNNTSEEVHKEATKLAGALQLGGHVFKINKLLWEGTKCEKEEGYKREDVNWPEVIEALTN